MYSTAPDFGKRVLKAVDHVDAHLVFLARHRIEDRLTAAFRHPALPTVPCAAISILKSIGRRWIVQLSTVEANTLKTVAPVQCLGR
jgi:hypothetical protein